MGYRPRAICFYTLQDKKWMRIMMTFLGVEQLLIPKCVDGRSCRTPVLPVWIMIHWRERVREGKDRLELIGLGIVCLAVSTSMPTMARQPGQEGEAIASSRVLHAPVLLQPCWPTNGPRSARCPMNTGYPHTGLEWGRTLWPAASCRCLCVNIPAAIRTPTVRPCAHIRAWTTFWADVWCLTIMHVSDPILNGE